jgi:hypothetical protein
MVSALRWLRYSNRPRPIWVDQLCINQFDNRERSAQILLMKRIYSQANVVHLLLGHSDADIDTSAAMKHLSLIIQQKGKIRERISDRDELENCLRCIVRLTRKPYWNRTWTMQEALQAKNSRLHWGTSSIPWNSNICYAIGLKLIMIEDRPFAGYPNSTILDSLYREARLSWNIVSFRSMHDKSNSELKHILGCDDSGDPREQNLMHVRRTRIFCGLVNQCRTLNVMDARDKVYGLLGLASAGFVDAIRLDYEANVSSVYASYTCAAIKHTKSLLLMRQS